MKRVITLALMLLPLIAFGQYYQMHKPLDFGTKTDLVTDASASGRIDTAVVYFNGYAKPSRIVIQFYSKGFDGADTDSLFIHLRFVDWWNNILGYAASGYSGGTGVGDTINMHASFGGRRGIADSTDDTSRVYNLIIPDTLLNYYTQWYMRIDTVQLKAPNGDTQSTYFYTNTVTTVGQGFGQKFKGLAILVDMHGDTLDDTVYIKCIFEYDTPSDKVEFGYYESEEEKDIEYAGLFDEEYDIFYRKFPIIIDKREVYCAL